MTERHLVGPAYLEAATALLQRVRVAHPTAGLLEDAHQGRGLARYLLAACIERLVAAGTRRVKVCFHPGNAAA